MAEVNNQVMSHKSYLKKWRGMTDVEAEEEIAQIAKEKRLFEESYFDTEGTIGYEYNQTKTEPTPEESADGRAAKTN